MNTIPYDYAVQLLQHREQHLQWVEKMQLQGDLALLSGDFAAYAKNSQRLLSVPVSESAELQGADILPIDASAVTLPPVTSVSCYGSRTVEVIQAAYEHGCKNALPLIMLHGTSSRLPYYSAANNAVRREGQSDIDYLLEKGGSACWEAAKEKNNQPDYIALKGICYMRGLGVDVNYEEALKCFLSVAKQSALAQFCIGICYDKGYDVPEDTKQAGKWYYMAAQNGCWQAAEVILYNKHSTFGKAGKAFRKTDTYKKQWLSLTLHHAEEGNSIAQNLLGYMYDNGETVSQDKAEAVKWYRKAAEQGNERAKNNLKNY